MKDLPGNSEAPQFGSEIRETQKSTFIIGADCIEKEMRSEHLEFLAGRLAEVEMDADPADFRRYGSARALYNFHPDDVDALEASP